MSLPHKDYVLPEPDLSCDEGDPDWDGRDVVPEEGGKYWRWLRAPGAYREMWEGIQLEWRLSVCRYEEHPEHFYWAWRYLDLHPAFWTFMAGARTENDLPADHVIRLEDECGVLRAVVALVSYDPDIDEITVWLETGRRALHPDEYGHVNCHDSSLDTMAPTYEQAIVNLARKVWETYGNDRQICDA